MTPPRRICPRRSLPSGDCDQPSPLCDYPGCEHRGSAILVLEDGREMILPSDLPLDLVDLL